MRPQGRPRRREIRHHRVRVDLQGTPERPRLTVYRSLNHIYAQIIDDSTGKTLVSASTLSEELDKKLKHCGNKKAASEVGKLIAKNAAGKGIKKVCFDRGGFRYHGAIAELATAARAGGLEF